MTPSLHPSEIRLPAPERRVAGRILLGVAAVGVMASFAAGAFFLARLPEEPAPKVTFTRIEDWPEIKNGVPELAPRKPAQAAPVASATPPLVPESAPPSPVRAEPVAFPAEPALAARPPEPEAVMGLDLRGTPAAEQGARVADRRPLPASEPPPPASASAPPIPPQPAQAPARAAAEKAAPERAAAAAAAVVSTAALQSAAAALPSAGPATAADKPRVQPSAPQSKAAARPKPPAKSAKAKPRTEKVASAPRAPETPPVAAPPPAPAAEDDRVHVLGLSLPNLLPSGRKIREAIGSLGL
jgi:hypothetical protein